jgi:hypothetical protein
VDVDDSLRGPGGRTPTHGYEVTWHAAMQAIARSWHREPRLMVYASLAASNRQARRETAGSAAASAARGKE